MFYDASRQKWTWKAGCLFAVTLLSACATAEKPTTATSGPEPLEKVLNKVAAVINFGVSDKAYRSASFKRAEENLLENASSGKDSAMWSYLWGRVSYCSGKYDLVVGAFKRGLDLPGEQAEFVSVLEETIADRDKLKLNPNPEPLLTVLELAESKWSGDTKIAELKAKLGK